MPPILKGVLSVLVAVVVAVCYLLRDRLSPDMPVWLIPALGLFMVGALWLFPEAKKLPASPR
ncbi:hypothetical protein GBZ26_16360 [Azospirillum formosense]|uniref:DUF4175 domain-containing protein n=1 Tax=Azospirillum formosense TaxID=861533 RepID=A0ABX2KZM4_9PROT|nr:hypothetical protein [Azospirillum formosense]MBY3756034.1 hypothetical protein [Azospirillum formosense]NUB20767.1 hypothetical protein [Azospirillum formosense]